MEGVHSRQDEVIERIDKLDGRVQQLERYIWIAFGGLAVLQLFVPFIVERFKV